MPFEYKLLRTRDLSRGPEVPRRRAPAGGGEVMRFCLLVMAALCLSGCVTPVLHPRDCRGEVETWVQDPGQNGGGEIHLTRLPYCRRGQ